MQVNPNIFKAYDIRGIYGKDLFDETAAAIGKALVKILIPQSIIVGRDGRVSGPALHQALVNSFLDLGVNVVDIGMVSTDMYYYACAEHHLPGVMITASHNPKEYNGFKMVRQIPYLLSGEDGIQDIRTIIENDNFPSISSTKGQYTEISVMNDYLTRVLGLIDHPEQIKPLKIVVDTANGMVGPSFAEFAKRLPQLTIVPLYFEVDGNFPNHGGDPLITENRRELEARVVSEQADLGFAFDPDGDRFFCIDKTGRFIPGDYLTAIFAQYFLHKHPGSPIVYDIRASNAVPDLVLGAKGVPLYNKIGHAYIKKRMSDEKAIFGGEITGHYYFADFYYCDSGLAPSLFTLDIVSHSKEPLDVTIDRLASTYFISGEINTKNVDSVRVLAKLEDRYSKTASSILKIDGVSFSFPDWHFNVRTSNTEPLIRLNLEAKSQELMAEKRDEVLSLIRS